MLNYDRNIITKSTEETERLGEEFAQKILSKQGSSLIKNAIIVCLYGDLGAGKTTFTKGFAKGLGIKSRIISPTFILVRSHKIPKSMTYPPSALSNFYHIDLYRLKDKKDVEGLGMRELLEEKDSIVLIEWPEAAEDFLPKERLNVILEHSGEEERRINFF